MSSYEPSPNGQYTAKAENDAAAEEKTQDENGDFDLKQYIKDELKKMVDTTSVKRIGTYFIFIRELKKVLDSNKETKTQGEGLKQLLNYNSRDSTSAVFKTEGTDPKTNKPLINLNPGYNDNLIGALLMIVEYVLNTKIIITDENNNMISFSSIENVGVVKDTIAKTPKILASSIFKKYDPESILFVYKQDDGSYSARGPPQQLDTLDTSHKKMLKNLYNEGNHEFILKSKKSSQLSALKKSISSEN